jgi:ketosteroid isomerase-like protein
MLSWLARPMLMKNLARLNSGDPGPVLRMDAPDVHFRFPGESSWAAELQTAEQHAAWVARFVEAGIQLEPDQVVVQGPPWHMTMCVRGTSFLVGPHGARIYPNRFVMWGHLRWGRLKDYEVYEDTQATARLDAFLAASGRSGSAPARSSL